MIECKNEIKNKNIIIKEKINIINLYINQIKEEEINYNKLNNKMKIIDNLNMDIENKLKKKLLK